MAPIFVVASLSLLAPLPLRPVSWRTRSCSIRLADLSETPESPSNPTAWLTTETGLRYIDDSVGDGELPSAESVVQVAYSGELLSDGRKVSFSGPMGSGQRTSPITFILGTESSPAVLQEALTCSPPMRVGGKRRLLIPPSSSFKPIAGSGNIDGADSGRFDIELLSVQTGAAALPVRLNTALAAFAKHLPAIGNKKLSPTGLLLLISFIPYFLPEELKPGLWRGGDDGLIKALITSAEPQMDVIGDPIL